MNTKQVDEYFGGFSWAVPKAFAEPVAACRFEQGDILYDTKKAYEGTWGEALPHISYSIQIKYPPRGVATKSTEDAASVFRRNWQQPVTGDLRDFKRGSTKEISATEGRLYMLLWTGKFEYLDEKTDSPPIPDLPMSIGKKLGASEAFFKRQLPSTIEHPLAFIMPYDASYELLRLKFAKVESVLSNHYQPTVLMAAPDKAGLKSEGDAGFVPTLQLACFVIDSSSKSKAKAVLKSALHVPAREKKTDRENFTLENHGWLVALWGSEGQV